MVDPVLRAHLLDLGASEVQLAGLDDGGLIGLAGDLRLAADLDLGLDELAEAAGCSPDEVRDIYRLVGLRVEDLAGFGDGDVAMVSLITGDASGMVEKVGPQLLRVAGALLAQLAEATVAAYVQDIEERGDGPYDLVSMADQNAFASTLAVALGEQLPPVFRHHMWTAVRRQRNAQLGVASPEFVRLAIGFVDLVGFTSMAQLASPVELIATIDDFERRAFETAHRHGGRIVKSIGDEVMIAAAEATSVAAIALELIHDCHDHGAVAARGGVSAGDVLFRLGDYYGPVVNLASRLAAEAVPAEVLIDRGTADTSALATQPAGRRELKGFPEPVEVCTITAADTTSS